MRNTFIPKFLGGSIYTAKTTFCLIIGYIGYYFCRNNLAAAFPMLSKTFSFTNAQLSLIAFYSELAYALGKIANGPLIDKFGGKYFFLIGMIGTIIFNLIFTMGDNLYFFIIIWCIVRYFFSMGWISLIQICSKLYKTKNYGASMSIISISFQLGGILATLFSGFLISQGINWKGLFIYPSIILFATFLLCTFFLNKKSENNCKNNIKIQHLSIIKILFLRKSFIYLINYSVFATFLRSVFIVWTPKMFVDLGVNISGAVFDSSGFLFLGTLSILFLGFYTDKVAHKKNRSTIAGYMLLGLFACLIFIWYLIAYKANPSLLFYPVSLCGFFLLGPFSMAGGVMSLDIGKKKFVSTCTGCVDGIGTLGGAFAVYAAGIIADIYGWSTVIIMLGSITLLAILSSFLLSMALNEEQKSNKKTKTIN